MVNEQSRLGALGFEDGELEMFFEMNPTVTEDDLIRKYLEVASSYFSNIQQAIDAPYQIPETNLTKHDLAKKTMYYIENPSRQPDMSNQAAAAAGGSPLLHLKMMSRFIKRVKKSGTNKRRRSKKSNKSNKSNKRQRSVESNKSKSY